MFFSEKTFNKIRKEFLSVNKIYKRTHDSIIDTLRNCSIDVVNDGRGDIIRFNAKYRTYSLISKQRNIILDFHAARVTTVGNFLQMEKEGLKLPLEKFDKNSNR